MAYLQSVVRAEEVDAAAFHPQSMSIPEMLSHKNLRTRPRGLSRRFRA
jgi:hypothetical protein